MTTSPPPATPPSTVHEAIRGSGPSGAVEWGAELSDDEAAERRRNGLDIVVRGPRMKANRARARRIEAAVGPERYHMAHATAGPLSLPHWHQKSGVPEGHSFFEEGDGSPKKARRRR